MSIARITTPPQKPRFRGRSHEGAFYVAVVATIALVIRAPSRSAAAAGLVFGATLVALFGTSALYHRVDWQPSQRAWMRRLDHSAIFLLIAGGYTPLFYLVPSNGGGHGALWAIWIGASLGVMKSIFWPRAPKWVIAVLCVGLGWMVVGQVIERAPIVGTLAIGLLVLGGFAYSVGAVVYALKRPDPIPTVFGYHEVFHALVVAASASVFAHVALVMRVAG